MILKLGETMGNRIYKNKIKTLIVMISFIPVIFFTIIFSRNIYNNRVDSYILNNQSYLNEKINIFEEEIISKCYSINSIAEALKYYENNENYKLENIADNFKEIYPYINSIKLFKFWNYDSPGILDEHINKRLIYEEFQYYFDNNNLYMAKAVKQKNGEYIYIW